MTEDELAEIERYCATTELPPYIEDTIVPALIAEVRRLRAELAQAGDQISDLDYQVRRSNE